MNKSSIFSLFITLFFMQWLTIAVQSADESEMKVTGAMEKTEDPNIGVVEDEDAKSGWAVDVKKPIRKDKTENYYVYYNTRTDPNAEFEEAYASSLCRILQNTENSKAVPVVAVSMIFPRQKGSCNLNDDEVAITATAQANTNYDDNGGYFPKTTPYELEVQILNYNQAIEDNGNYLFKVNFNVG